MQVWTNGLFKAAEHRVLSSSGQRGRYSAPFFYNPDYDTLVEPLDCAVVITSSSLSVTSQLLSASNNNDNKNTIINNNNNDTTKLNSTTLSEEEMMMMMTDQEGTTLHISTSTVDLSLDDKKKKNKKYSAIRWGDYRTKRFLGDFRDEGDEIQIEHFQKA